MTDETVSTCIYCGRRVVRMNMALGPKWYHQPAGSSFMDHSNRYCERTVATPYRQGGMIVSGNESE